MARAVYEIIERWKGDDCIAYLERWTCLPRRTNTERLVYVLVEGGVKKPFLVSSIAQADHLWNAIAELL